MDWKTVTLSLFLLVFNQVILGNARPSKPSQDDAAESFKEVPELSETKLVYLTERHPDDSTFHNESSVVFSRTPASGESTLYQIDTPIRVRKIRRRFKTIRNVDRATNAPNSTSNNDDKQLHFLQASDLSDSEESLSSEETRNSPGDSRDSTRSSSKESESASNEKFDADPFIPSADFPKKIVSQSRQRSSNGETRHALDVRSDFSEDTSKSDFSGERFGERKKKPSSFRNQQSDLVPPTAQKVTIVREKSVHSTSSEAAQERVNIEKNPNHNKAKINIHQRQQPRTFPSPQVLSNVQPQTFNNENQKIVFIQGTHIPGKNYGPEDDTFGFHANAYAYKDDSNTATPAQVQNGRKIKVVRVIKTKPDNQISAQIQLNNHNDGQSLQYFVSEHANAQKNKGFNRQHLKNQFGGNDKASADVPTLQQSNHNQFDPNFVNANNFQIQNNPVPQNLNLDSESHQKNFQSNDNNNNNNNNDKFFYMSGGQPVMLNISPDPNELYMDENTGQLIKFVIIEAPNQPFNPHAAKDSFNKEVPQFSQPEVNIAGQFHQKGTDAQQQQSFEPFGKQNFEGHIPPNINVNQNHQENIQHVPVSGGNIFYLNVPNNANNPQRQQFPQHNPQKHTSGKEYIRGVSDSKDDSEEYVLVCDQDSQDYSAEFQTKNVGPKQQGLNAGGNNYQQANFPHHNQVQDVGHQSSLGLNQNREQPFQSHGHNGNSNYNLNSGNHNQNSGFQKSNLNHDAGINNGAVLQITIGNQGHYKGSDFSNTENSNNFAGPTLNTETQGHYKVSDFSKNEGVTNVATPPNDVNYQGHYKGSEFSNNKENTNFGAPHSDTAAQGHYKGTEFSQNKGVANFAIHQGNTGSQEQYKGSNFNKGITNFGPSQVQQTAQGQYKGTEYNNKGVTNYAPQQITNNYKGSQNSNYKGATNFVSPHNNAANVKHYKGSDIPTNKGTANFAIAQNNAQTQSQYKGSEFLNNNAPTNFADQQVIGGAQGHFKGTELSKNKGVSNFVILQGNRDQGNYGQQINPGVQGNNKGSEFSNNKNNANFEAPHINTGGAHFVDNKGVTHVVTPQVFILDSKTLGKGSEHSNSKDDTNYAILQVNVGPQSHHKGSDFNTNRGIANSGPHQENNVGQGLYGGSQVLNKGIISTDSPQNNVVPQGHYKGSEFSTKNQNSKLPVYREIVTPAPVFFTREGNNKGTVQNQNNYKGGINGGNNPINYNTEAGFSNQQVHNINTNIQSNERGFGSGYNAPSLSSVGNNNNIGSDISFHKGYQADNQLKSNLGHNAGAFINNQRQNFGGNSHQQSFPLNPQNAHPEIPNQKGYNTDNKLFSEGISLNLHPNNPQFSDQAGYQRGNQAVSNNQAYNSGKSPAISHSTNAGQGDLVLLIQKGYNAESDVFPPDKARQLFSSKTPIKSSVFPNQKSYAPDSGKGLTNYQDFSVGKDAAPFSRVISSKNFNKGLEFSRNADPAVNNHPLHGRNSNSDNKAFSANQGYNKHSDGLTDNRGSIKGTSTYTGVINNNLKEIPVRVSQNTGYGNQVSSVPAFQRNSGQTQYGNQGTSGLKRQVQGVNNKQYGVSYSSSEENIHQPGRQYSSEEEPIQLLLVEEDIPGHKNVNNDGVYYIQYENNPSSAGNSQEQSYLILDDSSVQQHPNLKVMVDGGKDRLYPIRNLAQVGLHMARAVIPQIPEIKKNKKSGKSISGKINFGIEFKKGNDREYIQSRIDRDSEDISKTEENKHEEEIEKKEKHIQSRIDEESEVIIEKNENDQSAKLKAEDLTLKKDKETEKTSVNNQSDQTEKEKSR